MNFLSSILSVAFNTIQKALNLGNSTNIYDRNLSRNLLLKDIEKNKKLKIKTVHVINKQ